MRELRRHTRALAARFGAVALAACVHLVAAAAVEPSGFLGPAEVYRKLRPLAIHDGVMAERWSGRQMRTGYYTALLVDEFMYYPEARPGPRVSAATLGEVRAYLTARLRAAIGEVMPLANAPGVRVLRMQAAITRVQEPGATGPVSRLAALLGESGEARQRVYLEARFHDGETGELVGAARRELRSPALADGDGPVLLDHLRPELDAIVADAAASLAMALSARPGGG